MSFKEADYTHVAWDSNISKCMQAISEDQLYGRQERVVRVRDSHGFLLGAGLRQVDKNTFKGDEVI